MADGRVAYLPPDSLSAENVPTVLQIGGCRKEDTDDSPSSNDEQHRRLNWPNIASLAVWLASVGALLTKAVRSRKASPPLGSSTSGPPVK